MTPLRSAVVLIAIVLSLLGCKTDPQFADWANRQAENTEAFATKLEDMELPLTEEQWSLVKEQNRLQAKKWDSVRAWALGRDPEEIP